MKRGISQASMELPELAASCNFETGAVVYKGHLTKADENVLFSRND
jgi:hypothetical protein